MASDERTRKSSLEFEFNGQSYVVGSNALVAYPSLRQTFSVEAIKVNN